MGFKKGQSKTKTQTNNKASGVRVSKQSNFPAQCKTLYQIASAWNNNDPNRKQYCKYAMAIAATESLGGADGAPCRWKNEWASTYPGTGLYDSDAVSSSGHAHGIWQTSNVTADATLGEQVAAAHDYMKWCGVPNSNPDEPNPTTPYINLPGIQTIPFQDPQTTPGPVFCGGGSNCNTATPNSCLGWNSNRDINAYMDKIAEKGDDGTQGNFVPTWDTIKACCENPNPNSCKISHPT